MREEMRERAESLEERSVRETQRASIERAALWKGQKEESADLATKEGQ